MKPDRDYNRFKQMFDRFKDLSEMTPMTIMIFLLASALVSGANGQSDCEKDADCMGNQYCYDVSKICVNYTRCSRYNRENGSRPARRANQCGRCLPKYSAEKNANGEEPDSCTLASKIRENGSNNIDWPTLLSILSGFVITCTIIGSIVYVCRSRKMWCCKPKDEPEKPGLPILLSSTDASAPPLPSIRNNNNYGNAEESLPLSLMCEPRGIIQVDTDKPVSAQSYIPPSWVNSDPSYDPEETTHNQVVGTMRVFPETGIDEETVPSVWRPTEQAAIGPVPNRPFHAITMPEQEDNTTNSALDDVRVRPTSSTNEERRQPGGGRQYNGGSFTTDSGNNTNDNNNNNSSENRRNPQSTSIVNHIQVNVYNEHS